MVMSYRPQVMDRHVKAPLSSSASTRNVRVAMETNGKYAVKTGRSVALLSCCFTASSAAVQTGLHRLATTFSKERRYVFNNNIILFAAASD